MQQRRLQSAKDIASRLLKPAVMLLAVLAWLAAVFVMSRGAEAAIPKQINYQGKITNAADGTNVANGLYDIQFKIYDSASNGTLLWTETWNSGTSQVQVTNGVFSVKLGAWVPFGFDFTSSSYYLTVNFNSDGEMLPRKQLLTAPFAFNANSLVGDGRIGLAYTATSSPAGQITYNPVAATTSAAFIISAGSNTQGAALSVTQSGSGAAATFMGGNVGIGTTGPSGKLQVSGGSAWFTGTNYNSIFNYGTNEDTIISSGKSGGTVQLWTEGSEKVRISTSGNVGLGTTTLGQKLVVAGDARITGALYDSSNSAGTSGMVLSTTGSGTAWVSTSTFGSSLGAFIQGGNSFGTAATLGTNDNYVLNFETNGSTRMTIDTSGNVGIGITSPSGQLHVNNTTSRDALWLSAGNSVAADNGPQIVFNQYNSSYPTWRLAEIKTSFTGAMYGSDLIFATHPELNAPTTTIERMRIDKNGNVGIGTTGPNAPLEVFKSGDNVRVLKISTTPSTSGARYAELQFGLATDLTNNGSGIRGYWENYGVDHSTGLRFYTTNAANTLSEAVTINNNGNVGIGTANPVTKLEVSGSGAITTKVTSSDNQAQLLLNGNTFGQLSNTTGDLYLTNASAAGNLILRTNSTEWARITSSGNVGIGTTTPDAKLSVVGEIKSTYFTATATNSTTTLMGGLNVGSGALTYDWANNVTTIDNLQLGNINFDTDAGMISWVDMPVTASATAGTVMSYTGQLDGSPMFTVYGESDGAGGIQNRGVGVGTSTPVAMFSVQGAAGSGALIDFASSTGTSLLRVTAPGNVGIGTANPLYKLEVAGTASATTLTLANALAPAYGGLGFNASIVAKGGLITGTGSGTFGLQTVGSDGLCLTASSTASSGVAWTSCASASGAITNLNGLTASSQTFSTSTSGGLQLNITSSGSNHTFALQPVSGYTVPLTASTTQWSDFYNAPSNRITAGTGLSWSGNTLNSANAFTGSGTNGYLARWSSASALSTGILLDSGTYAGVNATSSSYTFNIQGSSGVNPLNVASSTGTSLLTITQAGNVGVGTTNPSAKLFVNGDVMISQPSAFTFVNGQTLRDNGGGGLAINSNTYKLQLIGGTDATNGLIELQTNNAVRMTVANNGNVGAASTTPLCWEKMTGRLRTLHRQYTLRQAQGQLRFSLTRRGAAASCSCRPKARTASWLPPRAACPFWPAPQWPLPACCP